MPKLIAIDDEPRALKRLEQLCRLIEDCHLIAVFSSCAEAEAFLLRDCPDIVLLDIEMPEKSGLSMAENIQQLCPDCAIIFTTAHDQYAIKAIRKNAFDYLLKPVDIDELQQAILRYQIKKGLDFSRRELEIISLLIQGKSSKEIANTLFLSKHTVDTHRRRILQKSKCKNTAELIQLVSQQ